MDVVQLIWLFFIVSALQPVIRQRLLEASRQRMLASIERSRRSRVILLVHRQETMSLLGFPVMRYLDIDDAEQVMRACEMTDPEVPIDIVLHTPGGLVLAATQIARALRNHKAKVTAFVPHYAMSGGTLIALAADEIVMSRHAVLGTLDPQLGEYPAASLLKVVERKPIAEVDDHTLIMITDIVLLESGYHVMVAAAENSPNATGRAQPWTFADPRVRCAPHVRRQPAPRERHRPPAGAPVRDPQLPANRKRAGGAVHSGGGGGG